jgi:hypothetical protein
MIPMLWPRHIGIPHPSRATAVLSFDVPSIFRISNWPWTALCTWLEQTVTPSTMHSSTVHSLERTLQASHHAPYTCTKRFSPHSAAPTAS